MAEVWEEGKESSEERRLLDGVEGTEDTGVGVCSGMML